MSVSISVGSVLVVDDEPSLVAAFARALTAAGFVVTTANDGEEAMQRLTAQRFDTIVSDISMPSLTGIGLLRAVRERDLDVPVVLVTGAASLETALEAVEYGALLYLQKPIELVALIQAVKRAVQLGKMARLKRQSLELLGDQTNQHGDRASLEVALRRALDGLWMAYQPIVHYGQRRIIAYEALLRSTDATLPNPGAMLDAAQRLGMLVDLGRAVRKHVGTTVAKSPIPEVFINLHPSDLLDDELYSPNAPLTRVARKIVLEITERAPLDGIDEVQARIAKLRELGFRIAIDDMGAGYAGLTSIAQLEPEVMKIDMGLVRDSDVSSTKQKVIGSMIGLCLEMDIQVIAEGVETPFERDTIRHLGCDVMQGFLFAKPGPPFPDATF